LSVDFPSLNPTDDEFSAHQISRGETTMVKTIRAVLLAFIIAIFIAYSPALASSDPVGSCPDGFTLHTVTHHGGNNHHSDHRHVGIDTDRNEDGWICGKHVGALGSVHVHIDNNRP
jgi:hypothetical protein